MPFDKLFVKIKCTMCKGTRIFQSSGYHNPLNPLKWKTCPYCDHEGLQLIEACKSTIIEYLAQLSEEERDHILTELDS